jgi:hypothetical protein
MSKEIINILEREQDVLEEILALADEQMTALIKYDAGELMKITSTQEKASAKLKEIETKRIDLISQEFNISRMEAHSMKLSEIDEKYTDGEYGLTIHTLRENIIEIFNKLYQVNSMNRLLANRARHTVHEILSVISGGNNHVCNVKI